MVINTGCKEKETLPEETAVEDIDTSSRSNTDTNNEEEQKEEFDSKNAYEYARLERILQELKRETDEAQ